MSGKETLRLGAGQVQEAAAILEKGGLVALPTETVYGLAADCQNEQAVKGVYQAKGRAETKPLSVLLTGIEMAEQVCKDIPKAAYDLAEAFWPGPLTMILPDAGVVAPTVRAGGRTLGVRCPDHALTLAVIRQVGRPLAAPSANLSGRESPTCAGDVLAGLDGRIDGVLDGGPCTVAVESTIVDLTGETPRILRQGGLPEEDIRAALGKEEAR